MKRFLGKCIEYAFVALLFVGLFFGLRYGVNYFVGTDEMRAYAYLFLGTAFIVFPASLFGGYFLARPIQHRLHGKEQGTMSYTLRGHEKPHGVTETRDHGNEGSGPL
ncbi:hypothetical protein [Exiguobacterium sp. SL-9]|jgi:hypothetical protein|uniref:hypothetical protein n=1 Tax=Exiguobacterium sp. SL-9 TaxID=2510963 RepID=UPI00103FA313|nr:hypothetical protein [Exiguobacterium sp. SL-9]TCI21359.1 hypothetical protein EVJ34_08800 [Exiguobacterium sp. SL-9]